MENKEETNDTFIEEKSSIDKVMTDHIENTDESTGKTENSPVKSPKLILLESDSPKKTNKFVSFLKSKVGICVIAISVIAGVLAFVFIKGNTEEDEYAKETELANEAYKKNLKEFVIKSTSSVISSALICDVVRSVWHNYIFEDMEYFDEATGTFSRVGYYGCEHCANFSEAVQRIVLWHKKRSSSKENEDYLKAKELYKKMTPPPSKYKETHIYVKQIFKAMEKLHDLSENPRGNFSSYSAECNSAVNECTSALEDLHYECDIDFSDKDKDED